MGSCDQSLGTEIMTLGQHIDKHITEACGSVFRTRTRSAMAGGSINSAQHISGDGREYFIKTNHAAPAGMFAAEAKALRVLADTNTVRIPSPICHGRHGDTAYLVLEYLRLTDRIDMGLLGRQLADMHKCSADSYGWDLNNTIGMTPQINTVAKSWIEFWRYRRLGYQLKLAAQNGYGSKLQDPGARLLADFPVLFDSADPEISMLHGDLWGGNCGALATGEPVIFDPAFYYGDRETDIAMTTLFGGFDTAFYSAYQEAWPLAAGYQTRIIFYNIYHILNHLNLFGGAYHAQAIDMIKRVLSEL